MWRNSDVMPRSWKCPAHSAGNARFYRSRLWSPNISDLDPVDFDTKFEGQRRNICTRQFHHNASDLKQNASLKHKSISRKNIDEAVDQWRKQLRRSTKRRKTSFWTFAKLRRIFESRHPTQLAVYIATNNSAENTYSLLFLSRCHETKKE